MNISKPVFVVIALLTHGVAHAADDIAVPHQFNAGQKAVAAQVNENFAALIQVLNAQSARIAQLETALAALQKNSALDLDGVMSVDSDSYGHRRVLFTGVNVQIVNGADKTDSINGVGNLIVGYNEANASGVELCSFGFTTDPDECKDAGFTWGTSFKSGSHNIVGGYGASYANFGGLVVGVNNTITNNYASISGGAANIASAYGGSVSGGASNLAYGNISAVHGGEANVTVSNLSSILGGNQQQTYTSLETIPPIP